MTSLNSIENKINILLQEFDQIQKERKDLLENFANYISDKLKEKKETNLIFICTHNSRRSHMSQIWAQAAAEYYGVPNIKCYSGGTESTAFNPNAVKAVRKAGFKVEKQNETENPLYLVYYSDDKEPLKNFSKVYSNPFNPQNNFAAIITCSDADENCPVIFGAEERFPIRYDDPKEYDGTELEKENYKERFEQIGVEMLYVFNHVNKH